MTGKVFWITGLSGSGKTTIGLQLVQALSKINIKAVMIDGDIMHQILDEDKSAFEIKDRLKRAYKYSKLCKLLSEQGINVVCCCIAMFDEIREYNRSNIENYFEIFIDVNIEILKKRDSKGLYNTELDRMVGLAKDTEFPKHPDLIINNTFAENADEYANLILYNSCFCNKNIDYWNIYYSNNSNTTSPSDFACFISKYLEKDKKIIDLGCGNGRDSFYFDSLGLYVTSIDSSNSAIDVITKCNSSIFAVCDNIIETNALRVNNYDFFYIRWVLHSMPKHESYELLKNISLNASKGSKIFIECRTINDILFGVGENVGKYEYIHGHYRRFIVPEELKHKLDDLGFKILFFEESNEFSKVGNDMPSLLRIIAEK